MLIVKEEKVWILIVGHRNNQVTGANVWLSAEIKQEERKRMSNNAPGGRNQG
jgi:hypothetical protein